MRIETKATLFSVYSPEDDALQIAWDVVASATVREHGHTPSEPGEILVEDIEIDEVLMMSIRYGRFGVTWPEDTSLRSTSVIESQRRIEWLNSQLDDQDHWTETIRVLALAEHAKQSQFASV